MDQEYQEVAHPIMEDAPRLEGYAGRVAAAVVDSEFTDSTVHGLPARRTGSQLNISYDQAMEYLGFGGDA